MELKEVAIDKVKPNPLQPREHFDREKIKELANSIKEVGLINPILVKSKDDHYEIIAGERRWKACQIIGMKTISAIIKESDSGKSMVESLIENVHREDLSDVEKAKFLRSIKEEKGIDDLKELSKLVGISTTHINSIFDSADIRSELNLGEEITYSVITETKSLPQKERKQVIEKAVKEDLGGRKVRKLASAVKKSSEPVKKALLKPDSKITPEVAEEIDAADVFTDEQKEVIIKDIERSEVSQEKDIVRQIQARKEQVKRGEKEIIYRDAPKYWQDQYRGVYGDVMLLKPEQAKKLDAESKYAISGYVKEMAAHLIKWLYAVEGGKKLEIDDKSIVIDIK